MRVCKGECWCSKGDGRGQLQLTLSLRVGPLRSRLGHLMCLLLRAKLRGARQARWRVAPL